MKVTLDSHRLIRLGSACLISVPLCLLIVSRPVSADAPVPLDKKCCNPACTVLPNAPAYASCDVGGPPEGTCVSSGCDGAGVQSVSPGICEAVASGTCIENAKIANLNGEEGSFECSFDDPRPAKCTCVFSYDVPSKTRPVSGPDCSGRDAGGIFITCAQISVGDN